MTNDLNARLLAATVGSCSCLTKTPEVSAHDENCLYRVLSESRDEIQRLRDALEGTYNWFDVVVTLIDCTSCEPDDEEDFNETMMIAGMTLSKVKKVLDEPV